MALLQGSSYYLEIKICEIDNSNIDNVEKGHFVLGDLEKFFVAEEGVDSDVLWDSENECFKVFVSQAETFDLEQSIQWQFRAKFKNGQTDGTIPKTEYVYKSLKKVEL